MAWYSIYGKVHHDSKKCPLGDNINKRYKRKGKGKRRRCKVCKRLGRKRR